MEIKFFLKTKLHPKDGLEWNSQPAKTIWCQRERWHHLPYVTHIATLRVRHC